MKTSENGAAFDPACAALAAVNKFCPRAKQAYIDAFASGGDQLCQAGITTRIRLAHFLAQVFHETGALTVTSENMNYRAPRIREVWPSRPEAVKFAGDPEGMANSVYANRMGNGPPSSGDGFRYRGRGILQTTGREAYRKYGQRCGVDFEGNPDLILSAEHALKPALAEWADGKCNALADNGDLISITKRINGGTIGLSDRRAWLDKLEPFIVGWDGSPVKKPLPPAAKEIAPPVAAAASWAIYQYGALAVAAVLVLATVAYIYVKRRDA